METEIWAKVPSVPEYEASNLGRIRRVPWVGKMPYGGERKYGGTPTYGVWRKDESRYALTFRGKNYKVSRMVCEAFHGPPPSGKPICMHVDEDPRNNRPENLKWATQKENLNCEKFKARKRFAARKMRDEQILEAVLRVLSGEKTVSVARRYGVASCTISNYKRSLLERGIVSK